MHNYSKVPEELKQLNRWCNWKFEKRNGKTTKIPIDSKTMSYAKSNDESTWSSYEAALNSLPHTDGIGFFFKEPYVGIDIDDVGGEIRDYLAGVEDDNIVSEFVDLLGSYSEVSPSGNGVHIILKGELPKQGRRKGNIEIYDAGRFFTVTGNAIGGYTHIWDDADYGKLKYLHNKYIKENTPAVKQDSNNNFNGNHLTEEEIIEIALKSKNGVRFKLFMNGGWEQFYDSQSEADMAFANDLAFWTARDYQKMDSIFRKSSLYREKYDRKTGDSTYGDITLNKAIQSCFNVFNPNPTEDEFNLYVLEESTKKIEQKYYSYDDTGNAGRFTNAYKDVVRYSYTRKNWYFYDGKLWQLDNKGKVKKLVDEILKKMKKEPVLITGDVTAEDAQKFLQKHIKYSRGSNGKSNMLKESQHLLPITPEDFDKDKFLINVQNGYIDLKNGTLMSHEREKFFTRISNVEFTDKSQCDQWEDFLIQIFNNDMELIEYIQKAVGYSLSGSTEEQMMFILYGNGRNGKSVFLDIITEMLGTYATNIQPQSIMVKQQSNNASPDIAKLDGARLVTTTEPNDGMRFDEGLVKQLTGGDKVTARFLHENEFEYEPQFKLWMATNHKPIIRGTDDGIWRRMAIIPFTVQIPEHKVDRNLKYKLRGEMTAILNWAVEGYLKWQRYGLKEPKTVQEQRGDYRKEMDPIVAFLEERCITGNGERIQSTPLYQAYREWASANGQYMMNSTKFGREMSNKFPRIKSGGVNFYKGISLINDSSSNVYRLNY